VAQRSELPGSFADEKCCRAGMRQVDQFSKTEEEAKNCLDLISGGGSTLFFFLCFQ